MPDIFDQLQQLDEKENQTASNIQEESLNQFEEEQPINIDGDLETDPKKQKENNLSKMSESEMGPVSVENNKPLEFDETSFSPEYSGRGFIEETGTSIMRGIGKHIIKGSGDMLQVAVGLASDDLMTNGNMLSRALQESGEEFASKFKSFIPEELQHENLSWNSLANPKFWSTNVAEMIPQLAEFIFLSKGGSSLARSGARSLAKKASGKGVAKNATKTALGKEIAFTGKGPIGALATDIGLTSLGETVVGAVGGGVTGNIFSGMLNAADVVNTNKNLKDKNGNPVYTEEELSNMATGTMKNNLAWIGVDIASWGMTYGGGWKKLRSLNPIKKGSKTLNNLQQSKVVGNIFKTEINPTLTAIGRLSGKAITEGIEETYQETFEEWAKMKAVSEVTGEPMKYDSYLDFYNSKENQGTKVLSAALGVLGGASFNVTDLINNKAEDNYKLYNRTKNLTEIINRQGTEQEQEWQEFYKQQQISEIVIDNKEEAFDEFVSGLVNNGNIKEQELETYNEMFENFKEVKRKAKNLNVKGLKALMHNNNIETYFNSQIDIAKSITDDNIKTIKEQELDLTDETNLIEKENNIFQKKLKALSIGAAEAKQNQNNLILGKKASPIDIEISNDKYGNQIISAGLSSKKFKEYVLDDDSVSEEKKGIEDTIKEIKLPSLSLSSLGPKAKAFYNSIVSKISGDSNEEIKEDVKEETKESSSKIKEEEVNEEIKKEEIKEASDILKNTSFTEEEVIKDEVYNSFVEEEVIDNKILDSIADKIYNEEKISPRENEIKSANEDIILGIISKKILDIKNSEKEKKINTEKKPAAPKDPIEVKNQELENDDSVSEEEKSFIKSELNDNSKKESITDVNDSKKKSVFEKWKPKKENNDDVLGLDYRASKEENTIKKKIKEFNIKQMFSFINFKEKLNKQIVSGKQNISQNELDHYLDSTSTYNLYGPDSVHKMSVVNHHLKRLFPSSKTQAIAVKNLFQSIGSQGVGHALASTIFIDEKAWDQNKVFMHELSHIFLDMAYEEPEVKNFVNKLLSDRALVSFIKEKYDDYTMYQDSNGDMIRKDFIIKAVGNDPKIYNEIIKKEIAAGRLKTVPLSQQRHLIHEMFAAKLEGPLSESFDKIFNPKNEPKRKEDVKKFWGLIKQKGEIINENNGITQMLNELNDSDNIVLSEQYIFETLKAATKGVQLNSYGLDNRADESKETYYNGVQEFAKRKNSKINNSETKLSSQQEEIERLDALDAYENGLENDGISFYAKDFNSKAKKATRILKKFGASYNKVLRLKALKSNKKPNLFNREMFESTLYNLAIEKNNSNEFGYEIESSQLSEISSFNNYLDKIYPNEKEQILNSMHFVLSNSKHVVGFRNNMDDKGNYSMENSLSQSEKNQVDLVLSNLKDLFENDKISWQELNDSVKNISENKYDKNDLIRVIDNLTLPSINTSKIIEQGFVTYRGNTIPLETLISGFIRKGMLSQGANFKTGRKGDVNKGIYYANARPLVQAIVDTNRKFTPFSAVENAEGNMEPVRITNNNLTKEVDNMISFMQQNPSKEDFVSRYSHTNELNKNELGKKHVPNQLLEHIYDNFQKGILPTISQYHGLKNISNKDASLYKDSTANEQRIEDFLTFFNTSRSKSGVKLPNYLGNIGTFSDSPRKFFMNMKRFDYSDLFSQGENSKVVFNKDGKVLNNLMNLHDQFFDDEISGSKYKFKKNLVQSIRNDHQFFNSNSEQLSKINNLKPMFTNGKLNKKGRDLVSEYTINSIVNGYNVSDIFSPGIKGSSIVKRFKGNTSPVLSVKNPNFKVEPIIVSDVINNNSISGSDSGMFITRTAAEKLQRLGKGVFEMNNGFKLLMSHVEKNNPKFKDKTVYLKGYTTIVDESHPYYKILKSREDKWASLNPNGSMDLSDGTNNHMAIIIPESSDKSNFSKNKLVINNNGVLEYSEEGLKRTPEYLSKNISELEKSLDEDYYDGDNLIGISSENFGPQQLMDKKSDKANLGVQFVNSIIVNAGINNSLEIAHEIQNHIYDQKKKQVQKILNDLKSKDKETKNDAYKRFIEKSLNKEDMDQAQRILLEDNGSLSHPYINEIVVNQLAKTIRREGNKLETPGAYVQQKPDTGFIDEVSNKRRSLKGYSPNGKSLSAAEIVLPLNMKERTFKREYFTPSSVFGKQSMKSASSNLRVDEVLEGLRPADDQIKENMNNLLFGAIAYAKNKHKSNTLKDAEKHVSKYFNDAGVHAGYYVKGETVIASRVPGHGPSSTGIFEVIDYNKAEGNNAMVSSEFNDIIGSDNDGDALFINTKGNSSYSDWNQAFDKITKYWLSPEMKDQIQTKMIFEKETESIVNKINEKFPKNKDYVFPFSPEQRATDYNNTMVSKRNVGPVFNIHKITNMLAAYEVEIDSPIIINGVTYDRFKDDQKGNESRNQKSAVLANIILDNAKHGYADSIGLDEHNISQAVLLTNLGVSLKDIGFILNSSAAKAWSEYNRNNSSMFHTPLGRKTISNRIKKDLNINPKKKFNKTVNANNSDQDSEQGSIIALFEYLSDLNTDVQKISKIMSGHNKIHVNPLVLSKQIKEFNEVVFQKENNNLLLNDKFRSNPDLKNYVEVAEETLRQLEILNPVYRSATKSVLEKITSKIDSDLSINEIESISKDLLNFTTSRLIGLNNTSKEYAADLINPNSSTSIYNKLKIFIKPLANDITRNEKNPINSKSRLEESILFSKALRFNLTGNNKYISSNSNFTNESFNEEERKAAQDEFNELPNSLKDDLILYDMIFNGWKGPQSLSPFFDKETNEFINFASNKDLKEKNNIISNNILNELEKTIALKKSKNSSNPFEKMYIKGNNVDPKNEKQIIEIIFKNKELVTKIKKGKPFYLNVRKSNQNSALYELPLFTNEEIAIIKSEKTPPLKMKRLLNIAKNNIKIIPDTLNKNNSNLDIVLISDKSLMNPYKTYDSISANEKLDPLVEASIRYEEAMKLKNNENNGYDAREDYYIDLFTNKKGLTFDQFQTAMEFNSLISKKNREKEYEIYLKEKANSNKEFESFKEDHFKNQTTESLMNMYKAYGEKNVYAYSNIITPVIKELAGRLSSEQSKLTGRDFDGSDVSKMKAHLMTGSTIPSNHPGSQGLARMIEKEYKNFIEEKKKEISAMNKVTDALYLKKLGYSGSRGVKNAFKRVRDFITNSRTNQNVYDQLYGNLVNREEKLNEHGKLVMNYSLKPKKEIEEAFQNGYLSQEEKDFYDHFRATTERLRPFDMTSKFEKNYIPHTAMSNFEALSSRGLLGLIVNSRSENEALQDVKIRYKDVEGKIKLMPFSKVSDLFKIESAGKKKNDINTIIEYRKLKSKAKRLLKTGINEDGSKIDHSPIINETVLGFGAINRFASNRSVKATEIPSMDLNKALGDYIHSSLFVNGNSQFKGMKKMQSYIDGVLAFNEENNMKNMNDHVQKVWKDYFSKGKRQESFVGKKADRVITGLTRLNLFYALGYQANVRTGGTYAIGNILSGKYHNIKDLGGKAWINGELKFWGLNKGFEGGMEGVIQRHKRMQGIMKSINFMEINVYDEVNIEKKNGIDGIFADLALMPMIISEKWIQNVHMIGMLSEDQLNKFDSEGKYIDQNDRINNEELIEIEDRVKSSHGRGYQPTDQRAVQMYSWGSAMLQFSKFLPTMINDRFAKEDVNIYGKKSIGTLRATGKMIRNVLNNPKGFKKYRDSLSTKEREQLDSGLRGAGMATILAMINSSTENETTEDLFWDTNYYFNYPKLTNKLTPSSVRTTENLINSIF